MSANVTYDEAVAHLKDLQAIAHLPAQSSQADIEAHLQQFYSESSPASKAMVYYE